MIKVMMCCIVIAVKLVSVGTIVVHTCHIRKRDTVEEVNDDLEDTRVLAQQRIQRESLVGATYSNEKLKSILHWIKIAARMNMSTSTIEDNKVRRMHVFQSS
jgi:hypothetical protein